MKDGEELFVSISTCDGVPLSAAVPVISADCPLERADKGKGIPEGGKLDDWLLAEGKVGTRGVATGMAARFRRGRLCVDDLRGGRPPLPSPDPVPETLGRPRSSELSLLSESEYTAAFKTTKEPLTGGWIVVDGDNSMDSQQVDMPIERFLSFPRADRYPRNISHPIESRPPNKHTDTHTQMDRQRERVVPEDNGCIYLHIYTHDTHAKVKWA